MKSCEIRNANSDLDYYVWPFFCKLSLYAFYLSSLLADYHKVTVEYREIGHSSVLCFTALTNYTTLYRFQWDLWTFPITECPLVKNTSS